MRPLVVKRQAIPVSEKFFRVFGSGAVIVYAALDKTLFFDPLETVCCSPITETSWNV
jgi:hypothetical protein